jgi:hypothetical protein
MPPFWTSTSLTSLGRQLLKAASRVPRTYPLRRAPQALAQLARETFPVLSEGSHHAVHGRSSYVLQPVRIGTNAHRPLTPHARLMASGRNFRSGSGFRARSATGNPTASNVGIGSARTFASGPTGSTVQANAPIVLRAFASLLSDEETEKALPRATRFSPYIPRPNRRRNQRRARRNARTYSIDSRLSISEFALYFPESYVTPTSTPLPLIAETLATPGSNTILSLPLSPSLSALLSQTADVPYADAEVGVAVFSSLTMGVVSLQDAFSLHYWHKIGPLLARLDELGFIGGEGVRHEMVFNQGMPDILRLTLKDRSEKDVVELLGKWLMEDGKLWCALSEVTEMGNEENVGMELTKRETTEMMEVWDEVPTPETPQFDLIYPTPDTSAYPQPTSPEMASWVSGDKPPIYPQTHSPVDWASGESSPISVYTPISDLESELDMGSQYSTPDPHAISRSLTASLLSQLSSISSIDSQRWSVQPSEDDLEVESAESVGLFSGGSEVWSDMGAMEEIADVVMVGSWAGAGEGFGLSQSW